KHEIEYEQMGRIALQALVELAGIRQDLHLKALFTQVPRKQIAQPGIVVDDEYLGSSVLHGFIVGCRSIGPRLSRIVTAVATGNDWLQQAHLKRSAGTENMHRGRVRVEQQSVTKLAWVGNDCAIHSADARSVWLHRFLSALRRTAA